MFVKQYDTWKVYFNIYIRYTLAYIYVYIDNYCYYQFFFRSSLALITVVCSYFLRYYCSMCINMYSARVCECLSIDQNISLALMCLLLLFCSVFFLLSWFWFQFLLAVAVVFSFLIIYFVIIRRIKCVFYCRFSLFVKTYVKTD